MPIKTYSTTASSNNASPPNGFPEGMAPASLNDGMRQVMADIRSWYEDPAWIDLGDTPTYIGTTSFSLVGDKTATYAVGRRIRAIGTTPFTIYGTIATSVYGSVTTVTVTWDSGTLNATLNAVALNLSQAAINDLRLTSIFASGAGGVIIKNSAGTTVATLGASATTATTFTGNTTVQGILAINSITYSTGSIEVGGTASSPAFIKLAEDTDNGTNKVTVIAPASIASDYTVTLPNSAGTLALTSDVNLTPWVAYTPTFTGFGTVSGVVFTSRRVGDSLEINGIFTSGTPTGVQAQITLGFNGTNGGITIDSTKVPSIKMLGTGFYNINSASVVCVNGVGGNGYINLGISGAGSSALSAMNGNALTISGQGIGFTAMIPITGWV